MTDRIQGRSLHTGRIQGDALVLDEPLSFWGGFDPATGAVIDQAHPQAGVSLAGRVVVMPGSRGSSGTPGVLAESIRRGTGPAALIVTKADVNLTAGALIADSLYERSCPIVLVDSDDLAKIGEGARVSLNEDGVVEVQER